MMTRSEPSPVPSDALVPAPSPEEVEAGRSANGGWTKSTLAGWGVPWPPPAGWKRRLADRFRCEKAEMACCVLALHGPDGAVRFFADPAATAVVLSDAWSTDLKDARRFTDADRLRFEAIFGSISGTEWRVEEGSRVPHDSINSGSAAMPTARL